MPLKHDQQLRQLLASAKKVAVVGASPNLGRDSNHIMQYLMQAGYRVIPVNPKYDNVLGQQCFPDVRSIGQPVDIVDVFRRSETVAEVVGDALAAGAPVVWLQLGVVHPEAERHAEQQGLAVVENRCIAIEHRRLMT
jgi:predicted CoA-binding protein